MLTYEPTGVRSISSCNTSRSIDATPFGSISEPDGGVSEPYEFKEMTRSCDAKESCRADPMTAQPDVGNRNKSKQLEIAFMGTTRFRWRVSFVFNRQEKIILDGCGESREEFNAESANRSQARRWLRHRRLLPVTGQKPGSLASPTRNF